MNKRIRLTIALACLLIVGIASFLPGWSENTTYTVEVTPIADAYVYSGNSNGNYGDAVEMRITDNQYRLYFKFNLSSLQNVKSIISMKLKLYVTSIIQDKGDTKVDLYYCYDDWNESSITWNNQPACSSKIATTDTSNPIAGSWIELDAYTGAEVNYITDNYILTIMINAGSYTAVQYKVASKEYLEADKWPRLVVEYEPYTETTTQTITETITVTETITETATETQTITDTVTTTETVIGGTTTVTETQTITETQTETITQTIIDTVYTTETVYTTQTETATQTITETVTNTATTTISQTTTEWATETITVTTTLTPTVTETVTPSYGNQTANYYTDLANQLIPLVMVIGVICSLLGLLLSATSGRR